MLWRSLLPAKRNPFPAERQSLMPPVPAELIQRGYGCPPGEIAEGEHRSTPNEPSCRAFPGVEILCYPYRNATDHKLFDQFRADRAHFGRNNIPNRPAYARALEVVVVENEEELHSHVPAWQDLADHAMEANVFYEPWLLRPALKTLKRGTRLRLVFIYETNSSKNTGIARLCGFFPLERVSRFRNLPVSVWRLWKHLHCFLCTPLIRPERAMETLKALLQWAGADGGVNAVHFSHVRGDGPFHDLLMEHANETGALQRVTNSFSRALWKQGQELEDYLQDTLSTGVRKEYRRQRKRLGELGRLEFRTLQHPSEVDDWLEKFLHLEASGWKAREGTALRINANERAYVREAAREGFSRSRMLLQGLFLNGQPVSMLLSFLAGNGGFTFKIAYDEEFAKFSPGVQIMLDVLGCLHSDSCHVWMDSCAEPNHPMINRLWKEQRVIESVLVSTENWLGDLLVSLYPACQWLTWLIRVCRPKQPSREGAPCAALN